MTTNADPTGSEPERGRRLDLAELPSRYRFQETGFDHVQQVMWVPPQTGGGGVHVDSGIARLLLFVWLHGWRTFAEPVNLVESQVVV